MRDITFKKRPCAGCPARSCSCELCVEWFSDMAKKLEKLLGQWSGDPAELEVAVRKLLVSIELHAPAQT